MDESPWCLSLCSGTSRVDLESGQTHGSTLRSGNSHPSHSCQVLPQSAFSTPASRSRCLRSCLVVESVTVECLNKLSVMDPDGVHHTGYFDNEINLAGSQGSVFMTEKNLSFSRRPRCDRVGRPSRTVLLTVDGKMTLHMRSSCGAEISAGLCWVSVGQKLHAVYLSNGCAGSIVFHAESSSNGSSRQALHATGSSRWLSLCCGTSVRSTPSFAASLVAELLWQRQSQLDGGVLLASCCGSSTQWWWRARLLGSLLVEAYSMITVFYDWNTASSMTKRYDHWFTPPLRRSGLTAQRPTSSMTESYDCWRQTLPSRGLAQLDLTKYWKNPQPFCCKLRLRGFQRESRQHQACTEVLFQPGFTGTRVSGFHDTSLQSNLKLYATSRCPVASPCS